MAFVSARSTVLTLVATGALLLAATVLPAAAHNYDQIRYIHTDAFGSVAVITDEQGNVVERFDYAPYGQIRNKPPRNGPGFTGHVGDAATGMINMQQRHYDPLTGRFISPDAVTIHDSGDMRHFNRYAYAYNNPYKFVDPDGRAPHIAIGGGVGALFGGGMELYRQLSTTGQVTSWTNVGIETAKGGAVGALTAAVPGSTALTFGGATAKAAVSVGNAVAVGASGEVAAQVVKGESIDTGAALTAGVANGTGVAIGAMAAPFAKAAATTTVPGNPGFQVVSNRGRTFTVNAIPDSTVTSEGLRQTVQDTLGTTAASYVDDKLRSP